MTRYFLYYCGVGVYENGFCNWCDEEEFRERMTDSDIVKVDKIDLNDGVMFKFYDSNGVMEGGIQITK